MRTWTLLAAAALALAAPTIGYAQTWYTPVVPGCVAFIPEYTPQKEGDTPRMNGAITICVQLPIGRTNAGFLDELRVRGEVQGQRIYRQYQLCNTEPAPLACLQRIARELPFPAPSDDTARFLARKGLSWE